MGERVGTEGDPGQRLRLLSLLYRDEQWQPMATLTYEMGQAETVEVLLCAVKWVDVLLSAVEEGRWVGEPAEVVRAFVDAEARGKG